MATRISLEIHRSRNALDSAMRKHHAEKKRAQYLAEKKAYEETPEFKFNLARRKVLQRYSEAKKANKKLLCDIYEDFYIETISVLTNEFNEYYLPKLQAGENYYMLEEFGNHYSVHIELLQEIDRIQTIHSVSTASNYIDKLTNYLNKLSEEYDVVTYFNLNTTQKVEI